MVGLFGFVEVCHLVGADSIQQEADFDKSAYSEPRPGIVAAAGANSDAAEAFRTSILVVAVRNLARSVATVAASRLASC